MILLWGLDEDSPLALVRRALEELGAPVLFLNHADVLETHLELEYAPAPRGVLTTVEREVRIEEIAAMYLRPYDFRDFPALASFGEGSREWSHAAMLEDMLWGLAEGTAAFVVNRPSAMLSNGSKPYQARLIERAGFATPETLVTTDQRALKRFRADHEAVVYKSISGVRSVVQKLSPDHEGRLGDLRWCPTQFQAYVPGVEYRVHVVGTECHACRICSDGVDYRYASAQVEPCELPEEVAGRCTALAAQLGLVLCGIDLKRTPDGTWVCFEVNPSPAFSAYAPVAAHVARAVASALASAARPSPAARRLA